MRTCPQNIIGVAFAPTQVAQTPQTDDSAVTAVSQRAEELHLRAAQGVSSKPSRPGKFAAGRDAPRGCRARPTKTPKFAVQAAAPVVSTRRFGQVRRARDRAEVVGQGARQHETATVVTPNGSGEARLYDKVAQADAGNRSSPRTTTAAYARPEPGTRPRKSVSTSAEAIAYALGNKADNPEVKKLFADLEPATRRRSKVTSRWRNSRPRLRRPRSVVTA